MKLNFNKIQNFKETKFLYPSFSFSPHKSQGDNKKGATTDAS